MASGFLRNDDPRQDVHQDARQNPGDKRNEYPDQPHHNGIHVEIVPQAGTDTSDPPVRAKANKLFRDMWSSHAGSAEVAESSIVSNRFSASIAIHISSPDLEYDVSGKKVPFSASLLRCITETRKVVC
jgi:hypothetical protein